MCLAKLAKLAKLANFRIVFLCFRSSVNYRFPPSRLGKE